MSPAGTRLQSVLFVCERNATRSKLAEAIARFHFGNTVYVDSAGIRPGEPDPFVAAALVAAGIPVPLDEPQAFDDLNDVAFDLIVTLSPEAHHRALELTRTQAVTIEYWPTFDPTAMEGSREQRIAAYRDVLTALRSRILERLA